MTYYTAEVDKVFTKDILAEILETMMNEDDSVIYLDADLMNSFVTAGLRRKFPDRALDMGVQEANMIGVAAGMSAIGKKPFVHTFGPFASRRVFDQVFLSAGYGKNAITVIGSDPGVTAAYNGGTHMPFEDIALYRVLPEAVIFDVADTAQFSAVMEMAKELDTVVYIRTPRKGTLKVYDIGEKFEVGKAKVLFEGTDATIVASGIMLAEALTAAKNLKSDGISVAVIDPVTIKPLDARTLVTWAENTGAVVPAENANVNGGLGEAVAGILAENCPVPMERVAVMDEFGEVGTQGYLQERFKLTAAEIEAKVRKVIERK